MIKYGYFVVRGMKNRFAVIAIECPPKNSNNCYKVSFAFCSSNDKFTKMKGREIASGRLNSKSCLLISNTNLSVSEVIEQSIKRCVNTGFTPSWFSRAYNSNRLIWGLNQNKVHIN
jgi:hypothetical protein